MCEWVIARLDELLRWDVGKKLCQDILFSRRFSGVFLENLLSIRLEIIEGTIPKVDQIVRKILNDLEQWIYWFDNI